MQGFLYSPDRNKCTGACFSCFVHSNEHCTNNGQSFFFLDYSASIGVTDKET